MHIQDFRYVHDVPFLYILYILLVTAGLVTISCEYFNKMPNDVLDKTIYQLMIKDSFWQDLNLCP